MQETFIISETYKEEILRGLLSETKYIPSKYFYDDEGSRLFREIMRMSEYYLTDCEYEILEHNKISILERVNSYNTYFELVELGAGDGMKTGLLIEHFLQNGSSFKYIPVDISEEALARLSSEMKKRFPDLNLEGKQGDYFEVMGDLNYCECCRKLILFLGSNIGNFPEHEAIDFFNHLASVINSGDRVLIGFDLIKDPEKILKAYNDPHGYTREFNLNLLKRLNRELGANFLIDNFLHYPVYDPGEGVAKSFLISRKKQEVYFRIFEQVIYFDKWEPVFTEMSRKFNPGMIKKLADAAGFSVIENYRDSRDYFMDSLWVKNDID